MRRGHIHDTYVATYAQADRTVRYIHQRLNEHVFPRPEQVMENIVRVLAHLCEKLGQERTPDPARRVLTLVYADDDKPYFIDGNGAYWRTYLYIEDTCTRDAVDTPQLARRVGAAFGRFEYMLADLPGSPLHETIPHFHDTRRYYQALCQSVERDPCNRAISARAEIEFSERYASIIDVMNGPQARGELVRRVAHNDTKINNVLFDTGSGEAICIIDLDTVMPGLALHDFGDLARTCLSPSAEDECDLRRVYVRMPVFQALVEGYLEHATSFLSAREIDLLPLAGKLITFETGVRFLRDYLEGDMYFRVTPGTHNLQRARNQFQLVQSMDQQQTAMAAVVENARRG